MIPECGPFHRPVPTYRGLSVRIHSRIDEVKCLDTSGLVVAVSLVGDSFRVGVCWCRAYSLVRNFTATGVNFSQYWKIAPCPEFG